MYRAVLISLVLLVCVADQSAMATSCDQAALGGSYENNTVVISGGVIVVSANNATLICDSGHLSTGPTVRLCMSNGEWSGGQQGCLVIWGLALIIVAAVIIVLGLAVCLFTALCSGCYIRCCRKRSYSIPQGDSRVNEHVFGYCNFEGDSRESKRRSYPGPVSHFIHESTGRGQNSDDDDDVYRDLDRYDHASIEFFELDESETGMGQNYDDADELYEDSYISYKSHASYIGFRLPSDAVFKAEPNAVQTRLPPGYHGDKPRNELERQRIVPGQNERGVFATDAHRQFSVEYRRILRENPNQNNEPQEKTYNRPPPLVESTVEPQQEEQTATQKDPVEATLA